jgi:hypothetical protein
MRAGVEIISPPVFQFRIGLHRETAFEGDARLVILPATDGEYLAANFPDM